jgi:hypothetical protein
LNPFEIHRIFKFEFVLKFISSFPLGIRSLRIVGAKEGIHFEFTYSSYFWKIGKIPNHTAQLLAPVFGPRCSDRAPSVQTAATVVCHGPWFLSSLPVIAAYKGSMWPRGEPLSQFTSSSLRPRSLLDANDVRHLCLPVSATSAHLLHRLSQHKGPPSPPLHVAPGCSPSHRSATLGAVILHRRLPPHELTIESYSRPPPAQPRVP